VRERVARERRERGSRVTALSNLIPAESLIRTSKPASPTFELAAPNPILGKTVFLRLPIAAGWTYEVADAGLRVERNLILRDRMWVRRGAARFAAVHQSGTRVEVAVKVRPWRAGPRRESSAQQARGKLPNERRPSRSLFERLSAGRRSGTRLTIRCHATERQIEIRWGHGGLAELESLLANAQCH